MDIVIKFGQVLLSLSLLIVLHEFGHYFPAKLFKTRVEKFFLFFDVKFSLFQKKIGETVYGIGWLPLGGYVKISGMIDESMDTEAMAEEPKEWEFRSKPAWQRLIIMLGGVVVNFIVAWLIYIFASAFYGVITVDTSSIDDGYWITSPILQELDIKTGDDLVAIDGEQYTDYADVRSALITANTLTVSRDGLEREVVLPEDFLGQLTESDDRSLFDLRVPFKVAVIPEESPNFDRDLKKDDIITSVNGEETKYFDQLLPALKKYKDQEIAVTLFRDGKTINSTLKTTDEGRIVIGQYNKYEDIKDLPDGYYSLVRKEFTLGEAIPYGSTKFADQFTGYFAQLKKIFTPSTGAYKGVGGFYAIYNIFPNTWDWENFWRITAILSIMLGVLNLLPIPALDGGHVMFLLYEMVTGRKPGDKFLEYAQIVGFFLLIALVLFANGNDIFRALFK